MTQHDVTSYRAATWSRPLDAVEPSRSVHNFSTPPPLEILSLLPVAYRVGTYIYNERSNGREPIFDMNGIQLQPPNPGPYAGVPLGGIGCGSIGRGFRGDFRRWSLNPGRYVHQIVHANCISIRVQHGDKIDAKVLSIIPPSNGSCLKSWKHDMRPSCGTYYARFPIAWTVYEDPVSNVKVIIKQFSPFLPGNYSESCLPAAVFDVEVQNTSSLEEDLDVSVMMVFQNGMNKENSNRSLGNFRHELFELSSSAALNATSSEEAGMFEKSAPKSDKITGVQMHHSSYLTCSNTTLNESEGLTEETSSSSWFSGASGRDKKRVVDSNSFALASYCNDSSSVTMCSKFQSVHSLAACQSKGICFGSIQDEIIREESECAAELWKMFVQKGELSSQAYLEDDIPGSKSDDGSRYSSAICIRRRISAEKSSLFRFALAWDIPVARFGSGMGLPRYHSRFTGQTGAMAGQLAAYALQQADRWLSDIFKWQSETLTALESHFQQFCSSTPSDDCDFYASQVFNELYFLVDGGSVWTDSKRGISNQSARNDSSIVDSDPVASHIQYIPASEGDATLFLRPFRQSGSEGELQKRLLDESPNTVTAKDISPMLSSNGASPIVILWEDLISMKRQIEINNESIRECGGDQTVVGQFLYLEGHEYLMYNTYDVHFYASFALLMLYPELELSLQRDITDSVLKEDPTLRVMMGEGCSRPRKVKNVVPHDVGSPSEFPWILPNVYNFQDVSNWKDLGTKYVLQVYRDFQYLKERYVSSSRMTAFLRDIYDVLRIVMHHQESFDKDGDGMIENSGFPDQTYDIWIARGVHAYCGGLWITACEAMTAMALHLHDAATAAHYADLAQRSRKVYLTELWDEDGEYFHYDNSSSAHADSIMSDMLAGQWYARACRLPNMVPTSHLITAMKTIYKWNVVAFGQQATKLQCSTSASAGYYHSSSTMESPESTRFRGAVNGVRPVWKTSSTSSSTTSSASPPAREIVNMHIDSTCLQSRECWTGTTYALAATMLQEALTLNTDMETAVYSDQEREILWQMAFQTARGIHDGGWQEYGYWFATPEGWESNGNYRSLGYMRALAIWAMQYAMDEANHAN